MGTLMHVLRTVWDGAEPALLVDDAGATRAIAIQGAVDWDVQPRRTCTGYWADGWRACPDQAEVGPEGQCMACFRGRGDPLRRDDRPDCIFEPACKDVPEHCVCSFGGGGEPVPHVVYLAFHGPLPKVGMTQERRLHRRLTEQGADAYLVVQREPDRQAARATETRVATLYGLPEWRTHKETLPLLTRPVERDRITQLAADWRERLGVRIAVERDLHWIEHPVAKLPARPVRVGTEGHHAGRWIGGKGAHLFYEARGGGTLDVGAPPVHAIKRSDLHGRWIEAR